jgi:hypothetical protein
VTTRRDLVEFGATGVPDIHKIAERGVSAEALDDSDRLQLEAGQRAGADQGLGAQAVHGVLPAQAVAGLQPVLGAGPSPVAGDGRW